MQLIDGLWYTLPDGTLVRYRVPLIGAARLETMDGTPAYIRHGAHGWRVLRWSDYLKGYEAASSDLTDDDLEAVF